MNFEHMNEKIRDLNNELEYLKTVPFSLHETNEVKSEIDSLYNQMSFYSNVTSKLIALYPEYVTLPDGDRISRRDYCSSTFGRYDLSQQIRMMVNELRSKYHAKIDFPTEYVDETKQADNQQSAKEQELISQALIAVCKESDQYIRLHPTDETKHIANYARSLFNSGNYTLTQAGLDSFIDTLRRHNAIASNGIVHKLKSKLIERMENV